MPHRVQLFTFKTGLLSRVAHDLRLRVERFEIRREGDEIIASFAPDSIRVDGVMQAGQLDATGLGPRDRAKIVSTIQSDILAVRRYPSIEYRGTSSAAGERLTVDGELELAGIKRPLRVAGRRERGRILATIEIVPSRYGIAPYKALGGAIRLQDRVRVELDLDDLPG